jgi:hypothetical protein
MPFDFTAAQVAERVCEVYASSSKMRTDMLLECFHPDARILELSSGATVRLVLISLAIPSIGGGLPNSTRLRTSNVRVCVFLYQAIEGSAGLREEWATSPGGASRCEPIKRLFIQVEGRPLPTFSLDFYMAGADPGFLPDSRDADIAVLYRVERSKITHVWAGKDVEGIGRQANMPSADVKGTKFFVGDVLEVLFDAYGPDHIEKMKIHYNDYSAIPSIG